MYIACCLNKSRRFSRLYVPLLDILFYHFIISLRCLNALPNVFVQTVTIGSWTVLYILNTF